MPYFPRRIATHRTAAHMQGFLIGATACPQPTCWRPGGRSQPVRRGTDQRSGHRDRDRIPRAATSFMRTASWFRRVIRRRGVLQPPDEPRIRGCRPVGGTRHGDCAGRDGGCDLDAAGFPTVNASGRTSIAGVWAAGNVVDPRFQVISSAGAGNAAAIAIDADLVQADVEGAVAERPSGRGSCGSPVP